jgi:hypothetical protein
MLGNSQKKAKACPTAWILEFEATAAISCGIRC